MVTLSYADIIVILENTRARFLSITVKTKLLFAISALIFQIDHWPNRVKVSILFY